MHHTTTNLAQRITARLARPFADVHVRRALAIALLPVILALVGALASVRSAPSAQPAPQQPIIILASPSPAGPSVASAPTASAGRALIGYFDYRDVATAAALTTADITRVVGQADGWRLAETADGAHIWIAAADVPAGTPSDQPLADLAPQPTPIVVYIAVEPTEPPTAEPKIIYVEVPAAPPPCDPSNPPFVVEQDVFDGSTPIGHVTGTSCDSQADARANAEQLAEAMKGAKP
jgi:hypothetical protein